MARKKGAKNRSTLLKELLAAGYDGDGEGLTNDQLRAKLEALTTKVEAPPPPIPIPEPVAKTIILPEEAKMIVEDTRRRLRIMVEYYNAGVEIIPERIQEYLRSRVFFASTTEEAKFHAARTIEKMLTHLMVLTKNKSIMGPNTAANIGEKIRKMESWATKLEKDGKVEELAKQRAKVAAMRSIPLVPAGNPWMK